MRLDKWKPSLDIWPKALKIKPAKDAPRIPTIISRKTVLDERVILATSQPSSELKQNLRTITDSLIPVLYPLALILLWLFSCGWKFRKA